MNEESQLLKAGSERNGRKKLVLVVSISIVAVVIIVVAVLLTLRQHLPRFGHQMRDQVFMLAPGVVMLNHGSYGATPRAVMTKVWQYDAAMELNTQEWFGRTVRPLIIESRQAVADYVGADVKDVVLVDNASTGINAVLRSLGELMPGDRVLRLSIAYPMVDNTVVFLRDRWGLQVDVVTIDLPTSDGHILDAFEGALKKANYTLTVFDHITSTPSLILPVKQMIALCRAYGVMHVIDGAHAVGQVPLNLTQLDPDFYTSNAHKWLCSAKGGAFLYVKRQLQSTIPVHPTVISNTFGGLQGDKFVAEFRWVGTKTLSQQIAIKDSIALRHHFGDAKWYQFNNDLCRQVTNVLTSNYGYQSISPESMYASLVTLKIPTNGTFDVQAALNLMVQNNVFVVIFELDGSYYCRLSCQVYNELSDYLFFAELLRTVL